MSTVLANTITAVGGGGSTVKVNNDSTYISEGGAVTDTVLISGLCKAWCQFVGTGTVAVTKSFNVTGITDGGTGDYTVNITNQLSPDTGPFFATGSTVNASDASSDNDGVIRVFTSNASGSAQDSGRTHTGKFGDLA